MTALDVLYNILQDNNLSSYDFKYCLVDENKLPFKLTGEIAKPNHNEDFVSIVDLYDYVDILDKYKSLGISIQASDICAIDIDHCVENEFDINSINQQALNIINIFKDFAYIEFSFSGHGIRILFKSENNPKYEDLYYTKNSRLGIEYYRPEGNARYVTITGKSIYSNKIKLLNNVEYSQLCMFLNFNMKRPFVLKSKDELQYNDNRTIDELMRIVKSKYLKDFTFQEIWFSQAPGSGKDESERDYHLIAYIYENITTDKDKVKYIFEQSPYFKSKDYKHMNKWQQQDFRYFNYVFDNIRRKS